MAKVTEITDNGDAVGMIMNSDSGLMGLSAYDSLSFFYKILGDRDATSISRVKYDEEESIKESDQALWVSVNKAWGHSGGSTTAHNHLGEGYAGWINRLGGNKVFDFWLDDSPDFGFKLRCGEKKHYINNFGHKYNYPGYVTVRGDIGKCTPLAFWHGLNGGLYPGSLWISVIDAWTQIVIEFHYSVIETLSELIGRGGLFDELGAKVHA